MIREPRTRRLLLLVSVTAGLLQACGNAAAPVATQTLVRVDDREITVHQLNHALRTRSAPNDAAAQALRREQLKRLVDQSLLSQQAERDDLHRDPAVMHALQAARREVLAQAWVAARVEQLSPPDDAQVRAVYDATPALFAQRRIWTLREIVIQGEPADLAALRRRAREAASLAELDRLLRTSTLPRRESTLQQPAEALPPALLERLLPMRDGQVLILAAPGGDRMIVRLGAQPAPLAFEQVRARLASALHQDRRQTMALELVESLRQRARIEYHGEGVALAAPAAVASTPTP